jgi:hypothetical protein
MCSLELALGLVQNLLSQLPHRWPANLNKPTKPLGPNYAINI